jgi:heterodisulfide reductase subunit A-like polyferredoxin
VVAACSCCSIDQACYSCTFQRIRCRQNLGVLRSGSEKDAGAPGSTPLPAEAFSFVNIREQCAWPHKDDPVAATSKATTLIAAAVAGARASIQKAEPAPLQTLSAMVIGAGNAATSCLKILNGQGIAASHLPEPPEQIRHAGGRYVAERNGQTNEAAGVLLVPEDIKEKNRLLAATGCDGRNLKLHAAPVGIVMIKPGMLLCEPGPDAQISGSAAASQMTAWFGRAFGGSGKTAAVVDPDRCRACNTCVEICDIGAPEILSPPEHRAWIDPVICTGCGVCAARCPSNAIRNSSPADDRLEAIIAAVLS